MRLNKPDDDDDDDESGCESDGANSEGDEEIMEDNVLEGIAESFKRMGVQEMFVKSSDSDDGEHVAEMEMVLDRATHNHNHHHHDSDSESSAHEYGSDNGVDDTDDEDAGGCDGDDRSRRPSLSKIARQWFNLSSPDDSESIRNGSDANREDCNGRRPSLSKIARQWLSFGSNEEDIEDDADEDDADGDGRNNESTVGSDDESDGDESDDEGDENPADLIGELKVLAGAMAHHVNVVDIASNFLEHRGLRAQSTPAAVNASAAAPSLVSITQLFRKH